MGACQCLRPREGATLLTKQVQRQVMKLGAAARQPGAEMNETYGMSTSEWISKDNSVSKYHSDLSWLYKFGHLIPTDPAKITGCASLEILSQLILDYPNLPTGKLFRDILG